ncbi:MAG: TolB-like 6-bladed beta-propeller domain-containing protein [Prevotellaceae bacterium]|nr:TolB-like 6-bladed beta-propeller domain-containing protein [Prevotellaceae bacterium]
MLFIKNNRIWIYDVGKTSLFEFKLEDFASSHTPEVSKTIKLNTLYLQACMSEDTFIASSADIPKYRFDFFNLDGKFLYSKGEYPPNDLSLSDMATKRFYDFNYTMTSDSKIFTAHFFTDLIEIYDIKGNLIRRCQGPNQYQPRLREKSVGGGGLFFRPVQDETYQCYSFFKPVNVKDEIFVLYFGDLYQNFEGNRCSRILVFDTDGNPLRIYKLKIPIISFTVDSEKRIIYGVTDRPEKEEDEFNIIKYEY